MIILNYIQSATNCIAFESLYSACCLNVCEQLMGHFEKEIDATEAAASLNKAISELITDLDGVHDELDESTFR